MIQERRLPSPHVLYTVGYQEIGEPAETHFIGCLETTLDLVKNSQTPDYTSIVEQLEQDPVDLATLGLVVYPTRDTEHQRTEGYEVVSNYLLLLDDLKDTQNAEKFIQWLSFRQKSEPENVSKMVRSMSQFVSFLDTKSLEQLYNIEGDVIDLRPVRTLYQSIFKLGQYTNRENTEHIANTLKILSERFPTLVLWYPYEFCSKEQFPEYAQPDFSSVVTIAFNDIQRNAGKDDKTTRQKAIRTLRYLEQSGLTDISSAIDMLQAMARTADIQAVTHDICKLAIATNVAEDTTPDQLIIQELQDELISSLESEPWIDAEAHNFADLIPEGTKNVEFLIATGTFGPFTLGHLAYFERIQEYINTRKKQDPDTVRFIVAAPLTITEKLVDYRKKSERVGTLLERGASTMAGADSLDTKTIMLTTKLPPDPAEAGDTYYMIEEIGTKIIQKAKDDIEKKERQLPQMDFTSCVAVCEFNWDGNQGESTLSPNQPLKIDHSTVAVGRHKYLADCLRNVETLTNKLGVTLVITNTPDTSSTAAIDELHAGILRQFPRPLWPFIYEHWNKKAISDRRGLPALEMDEIPTIHEISEWLLGELKRLKGYKFVPSST